MLLSGVEYSHSYWTADTLNPIFSAPICGGERKINKIKVWHKLGKRKVDGYINASLLDKIKAFTEN